MSLNLEKNIFKKEWEFFEETLIKAEESDGKAHQNLTKDSFLIDMHLLLIEKILFNKKKPQEAIVDWE